MTQRPLFDVPRPIIFMLVAFLLAQIGWYGVYSQQHTGWRQLPAAPAASVLELGSFGEKTAIARLLMLWLQSFDVQAGSKVRFAQLDYMRLEAWLTQIITLDPKGQYPLMAASRIYTYVTDETRIRHMLNLVFQHFRADPERRWPWLAHAAIVAKHRLRDMDLALKYSSALSDTSNNSAIPGWARQMTVFILQDKGDLEAATVTLRALLESGTVTDVLERRYLETELQKMRRKLASGNKTAP